jgi:hypothetical protein
MQKLLPFFFLLACRETTLPECQQGFTLSEDGDASRIVTLVDDALGGPVVIQLVVPWEEARYPHGAPGAVFIHGGWTNDVIPRQGDQAHLVGGTGAWAIYVNLPGGTSEMSSGGTDDNRGENARQAIGAALRYSAGMMEDNSECLMAERMPTGQAEERVLAAFSNGGNLAWATLADLDVELPEVYGIATFETPASGQMALGEPGTGNRESPLHEEGVCSISEENALVCDYNYDSLSFDSSIEPNTDGVLFLDSDSDGIYIDDVDFPLGLARSEEEGLWVHSVQVLEAAESQGLALTGRLDSRSTKEFWSQREAPRSMPAAAARFPDLAGIVIGTETDHVLEGATDHPHIIGMVEAMQKAGVSWTRLHPDQAYVYALAPTDKAYTDVEANLTLQLGDSELPMEPDDDSEVRGSDYITAATLELLDRSWRDNWSPDLDEVLTD